MLNACRQWPLEFPTLLKMLLSGNEPAVYSPCSRVSLRSASRRIYYRRHWDLAVGRISFSKGAAMRLVV